MKLSDMTYEQLYKALDVARRARQVADSDIRDIVRELEDRANVEYERLLNIERAADCRCPLDVPCTCQIKE